MKSTTLDLSKTNITVRRLTSIDIEKVYAYLQALSPQSKSRFGPHSFDNESILNLLNDTNSIIAYGAFENETNSLISYSLIRLGYLQHEKERLKSFGLDLNIQTDCTFAPSVADAWQNKGVGGLVFKHILKDLPANFNRIILWGGVQTDNVIAVNYYLKLNFFIVGEFDYNGKNFDMIFQRS